VSDDVKKRNTMMLTAVAANPTTTIQQIRQKMAADLIGYFQAKLESQLNVENSPFVVIDGVVYLRGQLETWQISNNPEPKIKYPIKTAQLELVNHE
jgi:hypothetical protein